MPKPALGQHYLIDRGVLRRIVDAAELRPSDTVLEVGPGRGGLTKELVDGAGTVLAIEMDAALADSLPGRLNNPPNLTVMCGDARTFDLGPVSSIPGGYKVVANLPYYAASPIVRRFLEAPVKPSLMVVTVQKEVAEVMVAKPGRMGILSVGIQFYGEPEIVCIVPPRSFRPAPRVTSAVVCINVRPAPVVQVDNVPAFFSVVQAGFAAPRKQLRNSLALGLKRPPTEAEHLLVSAGLDHHRRPATLSIPEWARLYQTCVEETAAEGAGVR